MYGTNVAMRYYRLWIYTCNTVLFLSVLVFLATACLVISDGRRPLLQPYVQFYHPTLVYAYLALILQGGVVQTIGFLGAIRLSQRLLNSYWLILFCLLCGDLLVGTYWLVRYERISSELQSDLLTRFKAGYGDESSADFQRLWDKVQVKSSCCGVLGPLDFNTTAFQDKMYLNLDASDVRRGNFDKMEDLFLPWSCCKPENQVLQVQPAMANTIRGRLMAKSQEGEDDDESDEAPTPEVNEEETSSREEPSGGYRRPTRRRNRKQKEIIEDLLAQGPVMKANSWCRYSGIKSSSIWHHVRGCAIPVRQWFDSSADALFVIGFCVIGFLKFTFLGLLRVEIKEMIQKIKVLQSEGRENGDLGLGLCEIGGEDKSSSPDATPRNHERRDHDNKPDWGGSCHPTNHVSSAFQDDANSCRALISLTPNHVAKSNNRKPSEVAELTDVCKKQLIMTSTSSGGDFRSELIGVNSKGLQTAI